MDPAIAAIRIRPVVAREPADFGGDVAAFGERGGQVFANARGAADTGQQRGLEHAWNAERGRGEEDAEGGGGADEQVLS